MCSLLSRVPILRKIKSTNYRLNLWWKDLRNKYYLVRQLGEITLEQIPNKLDDASQFVEKLQVNGKPAGRFLYSAHKTTPILYSSVYGALLYALLNKVDDLSNIDRQEWINYINSFQCEDGLYRDPMVDNDIAESIDWWGWRHLSAHVVSAITALGGKPLFPFSFLKFLYGHGNAYLWINELPWHESSTNVSNAVMNYGVLLQYERDFRHNGEAGFALDEIYAFLEENNNTETGLWYWGLKDQPQGLSEAVQTSYHLWNLFFYDRRSIPNIEKAVESCLENQNRYGGFGSTYNSSACEDIDSIDPLCRFYFLTDYQHNEIEFCLKKALRWVAVNQVRDGGFVFRRFAEFKYGHELMKTDPEESSLFATWFRLLSVAYISQVLDFSYTKTNLNLSLHCPGYQFWVDKSNMVEETGT